jgi:hypothetical protein
VVYFTRRFIWCAALQRASDVFVAWFGSLHSLLGSQSHQFLPQRAWMYEHTLAKGSISKSSDSQLGSNVHFRQAVMSRLDPGHRQIWGMGWREGSVLGGDPQTVTLTLHAKEPQIDPSSVDSSLL